MTEWTSHEAPAALRKRAQWYREYALICGGDNAWCLRLADHFDRLAEERGLMTGVSPVGD